MWLWRAAYNIYPSIHQGTSLDTEKLQNKTSNQTEERCCFLNPLSCASLCSLPPCHTVKIQTLEVQKQQFGFVPSLIYIPFEVKRDFFFFSKTLKQQSWGNLISLLFSPHTANKVVVMHLSERFFWRWCILCVELKRKINLVLYPCGLWFART